MGDNSDQRPEKGDSQRDTTAPLEIRIGRHELVLRRRYEYLSIVNDIMIGLWFIVGSILFFWESTVVIGTWLFLLGSLQLLVRPLIRLSRNMQLTRISHTPSGVLMSSSHDY